MELGPIQKAWIASLREHPERQMTSKLGGGNSEDYKACCLGEAVLTLCRLESEQLPFEDGKLFDKFSGTNYKQFGVLSKNTFEKLGLNDETGGFIKGFTLPNKKSPEFRINTLAAANDCGYTWLEIADLMEKHTESIFVESK